MNKPILLAFLLAGCVSAESYSARDYDASFDVPVNWQAAYAGIYNSARNCYDGGAIIISTNSVDGQLYSELGYGEVTVRASGLSPMTHASYRIERTGSGAVVRVKGPQAAPNADVGQTAAWAKHWATGGTGCPTISRMMP